MMEVMYSRKGLNAGIVLRCVSMAFNGELRENTCSIPGDIDDGDETPWITFLAIGFDAAACTESDAFGKDEFGEGMDVDEVFVVR